MSFTHLRDKHLHKYQKGKTLSGLWYSSLISLWIKTFLQPVDSSMLLCKPIKIWWIILQDCRDSVHWYYSVCTDKFTAFLTPLPVLIFSWIQTERLFQTAWFFHFVSPWWRPSSTRLFVSTTAHRSMRGLQVTIPHEYSKAFYFLKNWLISLYLQSYFW